MMELSTENVDKVFKECLIEGITTVEEAEALCGLKVEGVQIATYFDPKKVSEHKDDIISMIRQLDKSFFVGSGDGGSFLHMCMNANGEQWASFHKSQDALVCLGIAVGVMKFCLPRELWKMLPGGMPYISIDINAE